MGTDEQAESDVAICLECEHITYADYEEGVKLCPLHAQAPALLAALEKLERGIRLWISEGVSEADLAQAQAVIALAKAEQS